MSGYTPGTWRVGDAGHTVFGPPNGTISPETIATVRKPTNARLIAAAPQMAEALQLAAATIRRLNPAATSTQGSLDVISAALRAAGVEP